MAITPALASEDGPGLAGVVSGPVVGTAAVVLGPGVLGPGVLAGEAAGTGTTRMRLGDAPSPRDSTTSWSSEGEMVMPVGAVPRSTGRPWRSSPSGWQAASKRGQTAWTLLNTISHEPSPVGRTQPTWPAATVIGVG